MRRGRRRSRWRARRVFCAIKFCRILKLASNIILNFLSKDWSGTTIFIFSIIPFVKNDKFNIRHYMDKYKSGTNTKTPTSKDSDFWGCFHAFTPRMKTGYQLSTKLAGTRPPCQPP